MSNDNPLQLKVIDSDVRTLLNPARDKHSSPLFAAKAEYLATFRKTLEAGGEYAAPGALDAKLKQVEATLDKNLSDAAQAGAQAGGDPANFADAKDRKMAAASKGIVENAIDNMVGGLGGIFGLIWGFLKNLPGIGDMIAGLGDKVHSMISDKTPEESQRQKTASGIVEGMAKPITIEGQTFQIPGEKLAILYDNLVKKDYTKIPTATATVAAAAEKPASTLTDEQKEAARKERERLAATNTSGAKPANSENKPRPVTPPAGVPSETAIAP